MIVLKQPLYGLLYPYLLKWLKWRQLERAFNSNGLDCEDSVRFPNCKINPTTVDSKRATISKKTQ